MAITIDVMITSAVAGTICTTIGGIITAVIARKAAKDAAKETANQEIAKLEHTWKREDTLSSDDEYGEMAKLVVLYTTGVAIGPYDALAAIAALRMKEHGEIATVLDLLYYAIKCRDCAEADIQLDNLISVRRLHQIHT